MEEIVSKSTDNTVNEGQRNCTYYTVHKLLRMQAEKLFLGKMYHPLQITVNVREIPISNHFPQQYTIGPEV